MGWVVNNPAFTRGKQATISGVIGRWVHVAAVALSPENISLYVNGQNAGGSYIGNSSSPMATSFPGDRPQVARFFSNSTTYSFHGMIDELRLWNRVQLESEIREQMCKKLTGAESSLIGYWTFNETSGATVFDKSPNQFHGILKGMTQRVFSGASIGDESTFVYPSNWNDIILTMNAPPHTFILSSVTEGSWGAHVYRVDTNPSQTNGLPPSSLRSPPYFGVFIASAISSNQFRSDYLVDNQPACTFERTNNSTPTWAAPLTVEKQASSWKRFH